MSKHRHRHERAYAAGARDACELVKATLVKALPAGLASEAGKLVDNIRSRQFPMPEPNAARGEKR